MQGGILIPSRLRVKPAMTGRMKGDILIPTGLPRIASQSALAMTGGMDTLAQANSQIPKFSNPQINTSSHSFIPAFHRKFVPAFIKV